MIKLNNSANSNEFDMALQGRFLEKLSENQSFVTLYLINGVKLQGMVYRFDDSVIVLKRDSSSYASLQVVFKHAVATIMPISPISLEDEDDSEDELL